MINSIEPSAFDEGTCYVAGTRYKSGDFKPYLYKTTDYGKSWSKITKGINEEHFTRVLREDPENKNILYAGTETGMYISFNSGKNWKTFQLNLPIVPITDLTIKNNSLIVATQGRSLWMIDDLTVLHQNYISHDLQKNFLYKPKDTYRIAGGKSNRNKLTEGENLDNGVITYFNIPTYTENDEVSLTYLNTNRDTIVSFGTKLKEKKKLNVKKGANKFAWNMYYDGASDFKGMVLWWASLSGPKAVPGNYYVDLNVNGEVISKSFNILIDPRSESSVLNMQEQFNFITSINQTVDKSHKSIKKIRNIKNQLSKFITEYSENDVKDLIDKASVLEGKLSAIEKELYQTQNRSGQDPLNFPIRLTNKLAHLNSLVSMGDFQPTLQDIQVKEFLVQEINKSLKSFDVLMENEIISFNTLFNSNNLNYIITIN